MDTKTIQKLLPFLAIGAVVIWLVLRLAKSGSDSQVVNRVIPVQGEQDEVGLKQIAAQFELGKLSLENQATLANASINAEKQRLEFQNKALEFGSQAQLKALEIESSRQTALAAIAGDTALYDANIRANAARELNRQSNTSQLLNSLLGTGSSLLQSLLQRNQQQQAPRSSGGGSPSAGSPPLNPAQRQTQRPTDYNLIGRILDAFRNQPYGFSNLSLAGQYASELDLQPYYDREVQAYDNWLDYDIGFTGVNDREPEGSVTVDYSPEDFYIYYED